MDVTCVCGDLSFGSLTFKQLDAVISGVAEFENAL